MKDLKKTLYLGLGLGVKLLAGLFAVKLCAQLLGPEAFGVTGQLSSLLSVVSLLAGAGVSVGITKIYADSEFPVDSRADWLQAAKRIALISSCLLAAAIVLSSGWIIDNLFQEAPQAWLLIGCLAASAFPISYAGIGQGKINGSHRDDLYAVSLVTGSIAGIIGLWISSKYLGPAGALIGMIWLPVAQAVVMSLLSWKTHNSTNNSRKRATTLRTETRFLLSYGALSIATGLIIPVVYITIRLLIQNFSGNEIFGLWQATLRISEAYSQLPLILLTVVMFSRFAGTASQPLHHQSVAKLYLFIIAMMGLISAFVYYTSEYWIEIVFTTKFKAMESLVPWQLTGDTLRIASYVGTTILAARGKVKICIFTEIIQGVLLLLLSILLIPKYSLYGAYYAYISCYLVYFMLTAFLLFWCNRAATPESSTH